MVSFAKYLWSQNLAAVIHATNVPYTGRSHFDGQNIMETGALKAYTKKTGWLGRGMKSAGIYVSSLALSLPMPLLLRGVPHNNNFFPSPDFVETKLIDQIYNEFKGEHNELIKSTLDTIRQRPLSMQIATDSDDRKKLEWQQNITQHFKAAKLDNGMGSFSTITTTFHI